MASTSKKQIEQSTGGYREDDPRQWGWHGEFGIWRDVGGWITVVVLLLFMTTTHYNQQGTLFLGIVVAALVIGLIIDRNRRKNAWRK